jgi:hypothetical protein
MWLSPTATFSGPGPAAVLARFLAGWALNKPVLAVVDDLDEADAGTVVLMAYLGQASEPLQMRVNRRLRRRLALLAVVAAVAVVAGVLAVNQRNRTDTVARRADALRLATVAVAVPPDQLDHSLLVARQAWQLDDSAETRSALLTVVQRSPRLSRFLPDLGQGVDAADVSKDGRTVAVVSSDNSVSLTRAATGNCPRSPLARPGKRLASC